uniref:BTB domain-containing protein n=1 Tax=Panagrolaimus davidi TaxID=227884 RepID=A0A914QWV3_9BILA
MPMLNNDETFIHEEYDNEVLTFGARAFGEFNQIRQLGKLCDITIISNGRQFNAHKIVLAASIPYFYTMFTCGLDESKQTKINLDSHDADVLEIIINYAYTGKIKLTPENIFTITNLASYMQINDLIYRCQEFLPTICSINNIFKVLEIGVIYDNQRIIECANRFLKVNFYSASHTDEFLKLNVESVCAILKNDELHVDHEDQILDAAMRWINYDFDERCKHAPKVLGHVRLAIVGLQPLIETMSEPIYRKSPQCRKLVDAALKYLQVPHERVIMPPLNTERRRCADVPGVIYALGGLGTSSNSAVEFYDPLANQWIPSTEMPSLRARFGVAVKPDLLFQRSAMATAVVKDTIYVCGGYNGTDSLSSVEVYRPDWRCWNTHPSLAIERCAAAAAVIDEQIFVIGGHNSAAIYNSVEVLDTSKSVTTPWQFGKQLLSPRCRHGATTMGGQIYIAGGYDGSQFLNTVNMYDSEKDQWYPLAPMNMCRSRVSLVATDDKLYAIGGHDGKSNICSMEIYDSREDRWHFGPSMKLHEGGVAVGVIPVSSTVITR